MKRSGGAGGRTLGRRFVGGREEGDERGATKGGRVNGGSEWNERQNGAKKSLKTKEVTWFSGAAIGRSCEETPSRKSITARQRRRDKSRSSMVRSDLFILHH